MQRVNLVAGKPREQSFFVHQPTPAVRLFGRLENHLSRASDALRCGQLPSCCKQHDRVSDMATAVTPTRASGTVFEGVLLFHWQRVEVRTQSDGRPLTVTQA